MKAADKRISHLSEHNTNLFDVIQRANEKSTKLIAEEKLAFAMPSGSRLKPKRLNV